MKIIKERLIKWSREIESIKKYSKFFAIVLLLPMGFMLLCNMGILPMYVYNICWKILKGLLIFGCYLLIAIEVLEAVKKSEENIYRNHLIYILLSDKDVIGAIFLLLIAILVLLKVQMFLINVLVTLNFFAPNKIAEYFDEKLLK